MDLFERLRRDAGKFPWGAVASVFAEEIHGRAGAAADILSQLREWGSHLSTNALVAWAPNLIRMAPCESPDVSTGKPRRCRSTALVECDICGRPCCLAHARIDYFAGGMCEVCVGVAKSAARREGTRYEAPRPRKASEPDVAEALRALKLRPGATWDDVRARYKRLVVKHNADRPQSQKSRDKNTAELKKINGAFEVLRKHFEKKDEAA